MDWSSQALMMLAGILPETQRNDAVCFGFGLAAASVGGWVYRRIVAGARPSAEPSRVAPPERTTAAAPLAD